MNIVVLASGNGSTFQAIVESCDVRVSALLSDQPEAFALLRAANSGVCTMVGENEDMARMVRMFKPDLVVLAGYMRILPPEFVEEFPATINIHPSLLPKYKGLNTYQRALDAGDKQVGTTIHWVTEELDSGEIIVQHEVEVLETDTVETLQTKVQYVERRLYPATINAIAHGFLAMPTGKHSTMTRMPT